MDPKQEVGRFREDWDIDFGRKVIFRKDRPWWLNLIYLVSPPKYPVLALYRFARYHEATSAGIVFPRIVDKDDLPKIDEIPTRYEIKEAWSISESDLNTLYIGPLTQGTNILVPAFPPNAIIVTTKELVRGILWAMGAVVTVYGFIQIFV